MKVDCINGFFIFRELKVGQVSDFMGYTGLELVKWRDAWTFKGLESVPDYSIQGTPFLNLPATKTFEGEPWDLFGENGFVFNFLTGLLVPISTVSNVVNVSVSGNKLISNGLIMPGSILKSGGKIKSFSGYYSRDTLNFSYSGVENV